MLSIGIVSPMTVPTSRSRPAELQHFAHLQRRWQPGLLRGHPQACPVGGHSRVTAEDLDPTGGGFALTAQQADQGRLAGTIGTEQADQPASWQVERDLIEGEDFAVSSAHSENPG